MNRARNDKASIKVADETFIAAALLTQENPGREDFTISEIVERAAKENLYGRLRPGVRVHASVHCVANKEPNPGPYRMLYATGLHTRRLLLSTDPVHPERDGKIWPNPEEVPPRYVELIDWAKQRYGKLAPLAHSPRLEGILKMQGLGTELWHATNADKYVEELRENWE